MMSKLDGGTLDVPNEPPNHSALQLVERAVAAWRHQLVDLTGRNRLIYYKALARGTLDLASADPSSVEELLTGQSVLLSELYPRDNPVSAERSTIPSPIPASQADDSLRLFKEAAGKVRAVARTGQVNFEERGIGTTFAASHLLSWDAGDTSSAVPSAPVMLAPIRIHSMGSGQPDFELELAGDWEFNHTLTIFWSEVFGAQLDPNSLSDLMDEPLSRDDLASKFLELARATGRIPSLHLRPSVLIGNFSYTKLPMVKDLEQSIELLASNEIIRAIAGDDEAVSNLRRSNTTDDIDPRMPDHIPPENEFLILDADSSQSHVINAVMAGRSLIVEGPPGTGKSQTISNLIASLAANGQSVLFVAEKRAAIEAVLKRLEQKGLGDLALDLHTNVLRKKDLAEALDASLRSLKQTVRPDVAREQAELRRYRESVVTYERELHRRVEPWRQSSFDLNTELLTFPGTPKVEIDPAHIQRLTDSQIVRVHQILDDWASTRMVMNHNTLWSGIDLLGPGRCDAVTRAVREFRSPLLTTLSSAITTMEQALQVDLSTFTIEQLLLVVQLQQRVAHIAAQYGDPIWSLNLPHVNELLANKSPLSGGGTEYKSAMAALQQLSVRRMKRTEHLAAVQAAVQIGMEWQSIGLPWAPRDVSCRPTLEYALSAVWHAAPTLHTDIPAITPRETVAELSRICQDLIDTEATARHVAQSAQLRAQLLDEGLTYLVSLIERGEAHESMATAIFEHSVLQERKRLIHDSNPVLNSFRSEDHEIRTSKYATADMWHLESAPARVLRKVAGKATRVRNDFPRENSVVEREAKKKTRHKSLRQLHSDAGNVLTALKPCWIMSPLMVAQALPAQQMFDVVIFDEASQVRPEEAISAIARGRRLVVAGDRRQLAPSAFFDGGPEDVDAYDEDAEDADALTSGYQSILDVAGALLPGSMLTWHYRSRDERLISLSNDHIYDGLLTTFPGTEVKSPVSYYRVHHTPTSKDEVRSNTTEVAKVVDLIINHARCRPNESLGVIAFGQHHATKIDEALYQRLINESDPNLDDFFDDSYPERFFVKNIERVQGDERDAIILSVGYGKDLYGKVPHRFGPVNQEGGERRINVAASRARSRMIVVASIGSDDLNTESLGSGPQLLQALLRFAETGGNDTSAVEVKYPLNAFELAVKYELEQLGLNPISQYGVSGFRIDFALPHPANDGRMVLAVEADGASYHSSQTARDRDRLRQQILEDKGWRFHRIWSTAFFRDPRGEALRVKAAYEAALRGDPVPEAMPIRSQSGMTSLIEPPQGPPKPLFSVGAPIDHHDHRTLVELIHWITHDGERLMTEDQIKGRLKAELGYTRLGPRINDAFDQAIETARPITESEW